MRLIGTPGSPYVRKVRIVLAEKAIPFDFTIERASAPGSSVPQFNPLGKIPVLILDDGSSLYDSRVIVDYLDGLVPARRLVPAPFDQRIQVRRWEALGDGIADATVLISHDRRKPSATQEPAEWYTRQWLKIKRGMQIMSADLDQNSHCHGGRFGLADIATGYALSYVDHALKDEFDWREQFPNLGRLLARLSERPSFRDTPFA